MPNIQVRNLVPFDLTLPPPMKASGDAADVRDQFLESLFLNPLFQTGASIEEDGKPMDKDSIKNTIYATFGAHIQVSAEKPLKELYSQALLDYDQSLAFKDIMLVQSATKAGFPAPTDTIVYTPSTDVIPMSKKFLAGHATFNEWFATIGYYMQADILGIAMKNNGTFDKFKEFLRQKLNAAGNTLPQDTIKRIQDMSNENLDAITSGFAIRGTNDPDADNEHSFARTIQEWAHEFAGVNPDAYMCPFSIPELIMPKHLLFLNIDAHAHSKEKDVYNEYMDIQHAAANPPVVLSRKRLEKMAADIKQLRSLQRQKAFSTKKDIARAIAKRKFMRCQPSYTDVYKAVLRILKKLGQVQVSQNPFITKKPSYMRPNRRDPDNYNLKGYQSQTKYYPDIHLYIDTSQSISERMFANAVKAAIVLAKKLDINLYISFFSSVLSQPYILHLKGRTVQQAYREFQTFAKVSGGTDFEEVWKYIQLSKARRRELSLMITDFGYDAPSHWCRHPKNLYYMPCTTDDWDTICEWAEEFVDSCMHIDPQIRNRLLF